MDKLKALLFKYDKAVEKVFEQREFLQFLEWERDELRKKVVAYETATQSDETSEPDAPPQRLRSVPAGDKPVTAAIKAAVAVVNARGEVGRDDVGKALQITPEAAGLRLGRAVEAKLIRRSDTKGRYVPIDGGKPDLFDTTEQPKATGSVPQK